ncbi:hypothetical protein ACTXG6_45785 [Pseudonocardia sp. Cha107L01]|uniref:hypothetical protein n=1 Tax=Pseudonocardia sp. Cha107L01 TaxID=3457576 RepID=UPI00403E40D8
MSTQLTLMRQMSSALAAALADPNAGTDTELHHVWLWLEWLSATLTELEQSHQSPASVR